MPGRKRDIKINNEELVKLSERIKTKFFAETNCIEQFTGSVKAAIYTLLKNHIAACVPGHPFISESTLRNIMLHNHNGNFLHGTYITLQKYISVIAPGEPVSQKLFWAVNFNSIPGVYVNRIDGLFIHWDQIKIELEDRVICRCPRIIPMGAKVILGDFYGRENWVIWVVNEIDEKIASVWIGGNPEKNWLSDGYVRLGKTLNDNEWVIYQIFSRYSDGSYRIVESRV